MKLITFNTWYGRVPGFMDFFDKYKDEVDIFCLQEMFDELKGDRDNGEREVKQLLFTKIKNKLNEHQGTFSAHFDRNEGNAVFVRKEIEHKLVTAHAVHLKEESTHGMSRDMQEVQVKIEDKTLTIFNLHGLWAGSGVGKGDLPVRFKQSERIKEAMDKVKDPKILCGDFNLSPDTEALKMLEQGMKNLIKDYGVTSTRTSLYTKENKFADYILTSPEIKVNEFKVLPDEVSDHSPLYLDFEII